MDFKQSDFDRLKKSRWVYIRAVWTSSFVECKNWQSDFWEHQDKHNAGFINIGF